MGIPVYYTFDIEINANDLLDWNSPYSFFNPGYSVVDENGDVQRVITGSMGRFLGAW